MGSVRRKAHLGEKETVLRVVEVTQGSRQEHGMPSTHFQRPPGSVGGLEDAPREVGERMAYGRTG